MVSTNANELVQRARAEVSTPFWRHVVPLALVTAMAMFWLSEFVPLVIRQQRNHATYDYDLGIFDQTAWLLAHGQGFISLRGLPVLGHHLNFGLLLFAPAYWLGAGPEFLNVAMLVALAACVVPIAAICHRYRPATSWFAPAFAFAFLFGPIVQYMLTQSFYPEIVAMPFMFGALWAAMDRRWRAYAVLVVLTVIWKEDLALFALMLGIGVAVKRDRKIGAWTAGLAAAYFIVATRVVLAHFAGGGAFYAGFLGALGDSPTAVLHNLFTEPSLFSTKYHENDGNGYAVGLAGPWLFTPLVSPSSLLLALPAYLVNIFSSQGYTQDLSRHYVVVPFVATVLSSVRGALSRSTVPIRVGLAVGIVALTILMHDTGAGRWSSEFDRGIWPGLVRFPHHDVLDAAVRSIPDGASVSASARLAPHLTRRSEIYSFPNPWLPYNWGIDDRDPRSPTTVEWLIVDRDVYTPAGEMGAKAKAVLDRILASPCFATVSDQDGVVVARRTRTDCNGL